MKKIIYLLVLLGIAAGASAENVNVQTGLNYTFWDEDQNRDSGAQIYMPVTIDGEYQSFSATVLTGFVHTILDNSSSAERSLSCGLDTKLDFSYVLTDRLPVDVIFGLDFNLPTGKTRLKDDDEAFLEIDPDLADISRFGEGFNVNPTLSLAKSWDAWAVGCGAGMLFRGEYDYSEGRKDYKPGDVLNFTGEVVHFFSRTLKGRLYADHAQYGDSEIDGAKYYKDGNYLMVGGEVGVQYDTWGVAFSTEGIFRGKCKGMDYGTSHLLAEEKASYGDEVKMTLSGNYAWSEKWVLCPKLLYRHVAANDYDPSDYNYIGERHKTALTLTARRELSPSLSGEFTVGGFLLDVDQNWIHSDDRSYQGASVAMFLVKKL